MGEPLHPALHLSLGAQRDGDVARHHSAALLHGEGLLELERHAPLLPSGAVLVEHGLHKLNLQSKSGPN